MPDMQLHNSQSLTLTGLRRKYSFTAAVAAVDSTLLVIQYTPRPAGTLSEKYASSSGRYFRYF